MGKSVELSQLPDGWGCTGFREVFQLCPVAFSERFFLSPAPPLHLAFEIYHFRRVREFTCPDQFYGAAPEGEGVGIEPFIMLPDAVVHIVSPVGADIVFSVRAKQEIDPELHRSFLALILSKVEG